MQHPVNVNEATAIYQRRLIDCIFFRGWSTLKCAREIGTDPADVLRSFNQILERENN